MRHVEPRDHWPASWRTSYAYDLEEVYGRPVNRGYAYAYEVRRRLAIEWLSEVLAPGASILDIGAGQGNFSLLLAEMGYRVTWNDVRAELADYVRAKLEWGDVTFSPGNAFELDFADRFDAVLITEVIEHVAHPDEFLRNTARLVKPGGYVVMTTPNGAYFRNKLPKFSECPDPSVFEGVQYGPDSCDHIFLLHPGEVLGMARAVGLETERLKLFTNPLTNGHILLGRLLPYLPRGFVMSVERWSGRLPPAIARKVCVQMAARFRRPP